MIREATYAQVRAVQQAVLRPNGPLPGDSEPLNGWLHVAAEVEGVIVGACTIGPAPWRHPNVCELAEPQWQLRSMAVVSEHRGGTGTALLHAAMERAWAAGAVSLWANARVEALNLYLRAGWQVVGDEWFKPGVGPHRWIIRTRLSTPGQAPTGVD